MEKVAEGALAPEPVLPVLPVVPVLAVPGDDEPAPPPVADGTAVLEEPACSLTNTMPMTAVMPVAASNAPWVTVRTRAQARCRLDVVGCGVGRDISLGTFALGTPLLDHGHLHTHARSPVGLL